MSSSLPDPTPASESTTPDVASAAGAPSVRQARTIQRLCDATVEELGEHPFEDLSIRSVARRAGVAPATAYTYFSSREQLVTEVFWRRFSALPDVEPGERSLAATLDGFALLVADDPSLARACSMAMLSHDPAVKTLRDQIGRELRRRLMSAGTELDINGVRALELAIYGALVQAGMGHLSYRELPTLLANVAALMGQI